MYKMRALIAALLVALLLSAPAAAQRAPSDYRQTDAVLVHYPALKEVPLQSPAFVAATPSLTSQDDLAAFVTGLAANSRHLRLASLGHSQQGRDLPLLYFTQEGLDDPAALSPLRGGPPPCRCSTPPRKGSTTRPPSRASPGR